MTLFCCSKCFFIGDVGTAYCSCPNGCDKEQLRTINDSEDKVLGDVREKLIMLRDGTSYKKAIEFLGIYSHWGIPD
jgi:hypothetical protein